MWIILGVLAIPFIEIALFVTLGSAIGLWWTLAWVVLAGALGVILLKGVAMIGTHQRTSEMRENMRDPLSPIAHQVLVGIAGLLLLLPGFFTDAVGLLLLLPPVRRVVIGFIAGRINAAAAVAQSNVIAGEWRDITPESSSGAVSGPGGPSSDRAQH
jgi:UPF0716 protein FxsA